MVTGDLLARAHAEGTPVIDGERATFVWEGQEAPSLVGDFNLWGWAPTDAGTRTAAATLARVAPGVWARTIALPLDAYIEYAYLRGATDETRVPDPLNPRAVWNGMDANNHYFGMPDYRSPPWVAARPEVPHGTVTEHVIEDEHLIVGGARPVHLYRPPVEGPVPLLVVFDGQDYLRRALFPTIVDNLLAERRIRPIALAMVEHGAPARVVEYACSEATVAFLARRVLPLARERLALVDPAGARGNVGTYGVLGASMGGLIALYTALRLPHVFGRVLSQSGAFAWGAPELAPFIMDYTQLRRETGLRIWMDVGRFEFLAGPNRRMHEVLRGAGYRVAYHEYPGGHNYTCWRDDVATGLQALFGEEGDQEGDAEREIGRGQGDA
jgi:enterochelin esterase-like enzyme